MAKVVSGHVQAASLKDSLSVIMIEREQFWAISKNGVVREKLDETDTERCMGRDELGRLVWHAVTKGGS